MLNTSRSRVSQVTSKGKRNRAVSGVLVAFISSNEMVPPVSEPGRGWGFICRVSELEN